MIRIDRCQCFQQTFAALKEVADLTDSRTIHALQQHVAFGKECRLCHPYVLRMLETGETVFHEIIALPAEPE